LVDFIEDWMLIESVEDLSTSEILSIWPSGRKPSFTDVESALALATERSTLFPNVYPYRVIEDRLTSAGNLSVDDILPGHLVYHFLKICCLQDAPWRWTEEARVSSATEMGALLDELALTGLLKHLGENAVGVVFGHPPRFGRPPDFGEAVSWLADLTGYPDADKDRPPDYKDAGVDCVVWIPSRDGRTGIAIFFVQVSMNYDVSSKASESMPLESWKRWLRIGNGPITGFVSSHKVPRMSDTWSELNDLYALVFDRDRLAESLDQTDISKEAWIERLAVLTQHHIEVLRDPPEDSEVPRIRRSKQQRASENRVEAAR
jgi:hypothetical protein